MGSHPTLYMTYLTGAQAWDSVFLQKLQRGGRLRRQQLIYRNALHSWQGFIPHSTLDWDFPVPMTKISCGMEVGGITGDAYDRQ